MFSKNFVIFFSLAVLAGSIDCSVLHAAPAPVAYHHAVPYNVPPYADRVDIFNRVLSVPAVHALPAVAPAVHAVAPAVAPSIHAVAPALPAVAPIAHAVAPAIHAVAPALPAVAPVAHAVAPALGHIRAPLALAHALPAPIPAAIPAPLAAAYAYGQYGHPAVGAPTWRR